MKKAFLSVIFLLSLCLQTSFAVNTESHTYVAASNQQDRSVKVMVRSWLEYFCQNYYHSCFKLFTYTNNSLKVSNVEVDEKRDCIYVSGTYSNKGTFKSHTGVHFEATITQISNTKIEVEFKRFCTGCMNCFMQEETHVEIGTRTFNPQSAISGDY